MAVVYVAGAIAATITAGIITGQAIHEATAPEAAPQVSQPKPKFRVINGGKSEQNNTSNKPSPNVVPSPQKNQDDKNRKLILYHYTDEKGFVGILNSSVILPSLKALRPNDARYGDGQYFTDIVPGTMKPQELSQVMFANRNQANRVAYYFAIDVTGLEVKKGREHVFVIPNKNPLSIIGRLISAGPSYSQQE